MSRDVSAATKSALFATETDAVFVILLTITHDEVAPDLYFAGNSQDVVHDSKTFVAYPFELSLPPQTEDRPPVATLRIDNVHREIVNAIRKMATAPKVQMDIVRVSENSLGTIIVDEVEASFVDFRLRNVSYNALVVEGELTLEHFVEEPYPAHVFSPLDFPGMF